MQDDVAHVWGGMGVDGNTRSVVNFNSYNAMKIATNIHNDNCVYILF